MVWTQDKGRVVQAENGRMAIVSACMDISETMEIQKQITEKNHILMKQNKELNFLHNETTGGYHHCLDTDEWDFGVYKQQDFWKYLATQGKKLDKNLITNILIWCIRTTEIK